MSRVLGGRRSCSALLPTIVVPEGRERFGRSGGGGGRGGGAVVDGPRHILEVVHVAIFSEFAREQFIPMS